MSTLAPLRKLKQLQDENAQLTKAIAELPLDKAMLTDLLKNRHALAEAQHRGLPRIGRRDFFDRTPVRLAERVAAACEFAREDVRDNTSRQR